LDDDLKIVMVFPVKKEPRSPNIKLLAFVVFTLGNISKAYTCWYLLNVHQCLIASQNGISLLSGFVVRCEFNLLTWLYLIFWCCSEHDFTLWQARAIWIGDWL